MKKIAFYTLGCKVNQVETEQMKEEFIHRGYEIVDFADEADAYIINTCTVTHVSDRKSRAMVRRASRHPHALVAITGCMAQVAGEELADLEGVDLIVNNLNKESIADIIEQLDPEQKRPVIINGASDKARNLRPVLYSRQHERTRAFVKIQDGCQSGCSYCIVPRARGPVRSKLPQDVLREIKQLLSLGYREIVLTGIHTGFYGIDLKSGDLLHLLEMILNETGGDYRIRLSSLEPLEVTPEIIGLAAHDARMCRHFHIPLQSGSNKILKAMNRRYSREYYYDLLKTIAGSIPGVALTADVMTGFPGEEDKDFEDSYDLIDSLPFMDLHVFPYSRRPGTRAASISPQIPPREKQARSQKLLSLARQKHSDFVHSQVGQELILLVERQAEKGEYIGLSDNYIEVSFNSLYDRRGEFAPVRVEGFDAGRIEGSISDP
ncbi:tRNA (N(6)-L-threonylcarbamoyladenosine(37)-C(2))-methylthiotransferase MtaB [Syntrophomonas curvata]